MPVDRGGMDYRIRVEDAFHQNLTQFSTDITKAKADFDAFKKSLASGIASSGFANNLTKLVKASQQVTAQGAQTAATNAKVTKSWNAQAQAIKDANSAYDKRFRAEKQAAVEAARNFPTQRKILTAEEARAKALSNLTREINKQRVAQAQLAEARARGLNVDEKLRVAAKEISEATARQLVAERKLAAIRTDASNVRLQQIKAESRALEIQRRADEKRQVDALLANRGLGPDGNPIPPAEQKTLKDRIKDFLGLGKAVDGASDATNRHFFSMTRLFQIYTAFTIVRQTATIFKGLIKQTIDLNSQIEITTLGISSLIASIADIRDTSGNPAEPMEKLQIATEEARKQVQKLRIDALSTTATFDDLVQTFQIALGPGLSAGLDIDQVREFTRQISIAATTLGLEQRQLSEEIRSILQGTIRKGQTRIADALNIDNQDIKNANKTGELFQFLQKRFVQFDEAGKRAARTFPGLAERIKDGFQLILQAGGVQFFERLKTSLEDMLALFIEVDTATNKIKPNSALVELVQIVGEGLGVAVDEAERLMKTLGVDQARQFARTLSDGIALFARILSSALEGAILGFNFILAQVQQIRSVVQSLTGLDLLSNKSLATAVKYVTAFLVAITSINGIVALVVFGFGRLIPLLKIGGSLLKGIVGTFKLANKAMVALGGASSPFLATLLAALAAATAVAVEIGIIAGFIDTSNTAPNIKLANKLTQGWLLARAAIAGITGDEKEASEVSRLWTQQQEQFNTELQNSTSVSDAFGEAWNKVEGSIVGSVKRIRDEIAKIDQPTEEPGGTILALSSAIEKLRDILQGLSDDLDKANDKLQVSLGTVGLQGNVLKIVENRLEAQVQANRDLVELEKEKKTALEEVKKLEQQLDAFERGRDQTRDDQNISEEEIKAEERLAAIKGRIRDLDAIKVELTQKRLTLADKENSAILQTANFEGRREVILKRIEASHAEALRIAEQRRDASAVALIQAQQEFETIKQQNKNNQQDREREIAFLKEEIRLSNERLAIQQQIEHDNPGDFNTGPAIAAEAATNAALNQQLIIKQKINEEEGKIAAQQQIRAQNELRILEIQKEAPIGAGIVEGFAQAFLEVSDLFKVTVDIMRGTIEGFSQFVSQSIIDAFDPTADTSIQERFARFLQQLAAQIITTLTTLAITAAVLNAASGGLLGPLLQEFAQLRFPGGFVDGGEVGEGRVLRDHRRRFSRAKGYNQGGSPSERGIHGMARPSGLHPKDTVALWADPTEWIVRGREVMRIGRDFMQNFNSGNYDPLALRAAMGLGHARRTANHVRRSAGGLAAGGPASSVRPKSVASSGAVGIASAPGVALVVPSEDAADRTLRGGQQALFKLLAENGYRPNA